MTDPKLEAYLSELDQCMSQIPVSERADIITEIKSHVLDAQQRYPEQNMNTILQSMGSAEEVAKRYLQDRGLKLTKPTNPSSMMWVASTVKWLMIGFISFLIIIVISICLIVWKFSPIISVDEKTDHVVIGGGLIDVRGTEINKGPHALPKPPENKSAQ